MKKIKCSDCESFFWDEDYQDFNGKVIPHNYFVKNQGGFLVKTSLTCPASMRLLTNILK